MKISIWHHTADQQPLSSGYYLTYRGWGMGGKVDGESDHGYLYYHSQTDRWYEYQSEVRSMHPRTCIVYYWTDADPQQWVDDDPPVTLRKKIREDQPAVKAAWDNLQKALEQYNIIKELSGQ